MKLGKIFLGVLVGVGAVAAAPFTGGGSVLGGATLIASLTGAGAIDAGAGVAGGVAGGLLQKKKDEEEEALRRKAKATGFNDGLKKGEAEAIKKCNEILSTTRAVNDLIIGMTAFCYAVAWSDNKVSVEEKIELDYYLNFFKNNNTLSEAVKTKITEISSKQISFEECKLYLNKISLEDLNRLTECINNIVHADGIVSTEEKEIILKWENYLNERK